MIVRLNASMPLKTFSKSFYFFLPAAWKCHFSIFEWPPFADPAKGSLC